MNKTFKKILSVCCTVVTTLTATLFRSTEVHADNIYKIVFIGDEKVGKTQLVKRIANGEFSEDYKCTIGVDILISTTTAGNSLQLWDTTGQKCWRDIVPAYYTKTDVLLYCCSTQQLKSQTQNCNIAQYNIPRGSKVLICITQEDTMTDDTSETKTQLDRALQTFQTAATECNILSEILVTSAMKNQYKFCTPENYDSTVYKDIHSNLAEDLVTLCRGQETAQNTVKSDQTDGMCGDSENAGYDRASKHTSLSDTDNSSYGKKPTMHLGYWLGVPTSLISLGLIGRLGGYYGYERHKKKKAVNPKPHTMQKKSHSQTC